LVIAWSFTIVLRAGCWRKAASVRKSQQDYFAATTFSRSIFSNEIRHLSTFRRNHIPAGIGVA
jgi:hypothetical protein